MTTDSSQRAFLQDAKRKLSVSHPNLTWDRLAQIVGIEPRALKTYRMPQTSPDFREMPKVVRAVIENLLTGPPPAPGEAASSDADQTQESLLPTALAALVVRQARQAIVHDRPISGVERRVGDSIGLDREDRQAMALVSRARLRTGLSDVGSEIHDLLFHCTQPLGDWIPLPQIHAQRLSQIVLLDAEEGVPTREAEELARRFVSVTASLEELLFSRFHEQLARNSREAAAGYYSQVREFVVRHPIVTAVELARLTAELPSSLGVLIHQQFYEPLPEGWGDDGHLSICSHCGNALQTITTGAHCRTKACAESKPTKTESHVLIQESLRLSRGMRQYWQEPGFDEMQLFDELVVAGFAPSLYPELDRVDLAIGEVGIDLKAYISPELLGTRISNRLGGLAHYRHKWLVIPDRLINRVPAYLERLRSALGEASGVRVLASSSVALELSRA